MSTSWTKNEFQTQRVLKVDRILIRAFKASENREMSEKFADAYSQVLVNHGIKKVSSANHDWVDSPTVYVILAQSPSGHRLYGGARIEMKELTNRLPIQKAVGHLDERVHEVVDALHTDGGCAELCALWTSPEVVGLGFGAKSIIMVGLSMLDSLKIRHFLALSSPVTRKFMPDFGFETIESIGENGAFPYPNEKLVATVAHHIYPECFDKMNPEYLAVVEEMKSTPGMFFKSKGPKGEVTIQLDLNVSK